MRAVRVKIGIVFALLGTSDSIVAQRATRVAASQSVMVGILREDSVLMPFARFDGVSWRHTWPDMRGLDGSLVSSDIPRLAVVPRSWWSGGRPALRWELVRANGIRHPVTVTRTTMYSADYGENVGLFTDYVTENSFSATSLDASSLASARRRLAGVVATEPGALTPISEIPKDSREFQAIEDLLPSIFDRVEPDLWKGREAFERLRTSASLSYRLEVHAGQLPDGRRLFVANAHHHLDNSMITAFTAWFSQQAASGLALLAIDVQGSDVDLKGEHPLIPLSSVTLGRRTFWIAADCGYEGGGYKILEVTRGAPRAIAEMNAGGCL